MSEEEKKARSEYDFFAAKEIITVLGRLGKAVSELVEVDTELTRVLRKFVDFERLCHGSVDPAKENFYDEAQLGHSGSPTASSKMIQRITDEDQIPQCDSTHPGKTTQASEGGSEGEYEFFCKIFLLLTCCRLVYRIYPGF